jgi:hypothetical protein
MVYPDLPTLVFEGNVASKHNPPSQELEADTQAIPPRSGVGTEQYSGESPGRSCTERTPRSEIRWVRRGTCGDYILEAIKQ